MKRAWPLALPGLCLGVFMGVSTGVLWLAGATAMSALDGAFAALAGVQPQSFAFSETDIHPALVAVLYGAGLLVRLFLIACWAAHLVRRAGERNDLRKIRRALEVRMRPETADVPGLPRTIHWN